MHLARPLALFLILLLALWFWRARRRRLAALRFPSLALVASLPPGRARPARRGALLLEALVFLCLLLALVGIRLPETNSRAPTEGISIALVLDASASMGNVDFADEGVLKSR